jgi:hypothetical protein
MISLLLMTRCSGHGALVILIWSVKMRMAGCTWVNECESGVQVEFDVPGC